MWGQDLSDTGVAAVATAEIDERKAADSWLGGATTHGRAEGLPRGEERNTPLVSQAIRRAQAGDRDAMGFLYARYAESIHGYVRSIVRNHHEAEDITQHVFTKLMRVIGKYEERDVPFLAWALRVARNVTMDHIRGERLVPVEEIHATGREESDPAAGGASRGVARGARHAALRPTRGADPAPRSGALAAGDRRADRQERGVDPRPAPPRAPHARGRADQPRAWRRRRWPAARGTELSPGLPKRACQAGRRSGPAEAACRAPKRRRLQPSSSSPMGCGWSAGSGSGTGGGRREIRPLSRSAR